MNQPVGDVSNTPSSFIGDYRGLAVNSNNSLVLPIWTDQRSGQGAYIDRGVIAGGGTPTPTVLASSTPTPACGPSAWSAGPALGPPARYGFQGAVANDGKFYVTGGQDAANVTVYNEAARYNPTSNTWESIAPMPIAVGQDVGRVGPTARFTLRVAAWEARVLPARCKSTTSPLTPGALELDACLGGGSSGHRAERQVLRGRRR